MTQVAVSVEPLQRHHIERFEAREERIATNGGAGTSSFALAGKTGKVYGLIEFAMMWPGVATARALISDDARGHGVAVVRACRRLLGAYTEQRQLRQISIWVHAEEGEYLRFATLLGFVEEYRNRAAAPDGGDLVLFVLRSEPRMH